MKPMKQRRTIRTAAERRTICRSIAAPVFLALLIVCSAARPNLASAQVTSVGEKSMGANHDQELPQVLQKVQVQQRLNQQLPLDAPFVDETGKNVVLGDYFGKHPVLLSLVYYQCPMLCSEELNGMVEALEMVHLRPGRDFEIVVVSIDPSETPALAEAKKLIYVKRYGHPETAAGWHFLTGQRPAIDALTTAVGFGYVRVPGPDGKLTQFAHASSLEIVTPQGRIAQYYLGVEYSPKDILLGLVEASGNKIGSPVANILTYCYHYDPRTNKHSLVVARVVQLGGMVTVVSLGGFMFVMFRRDIKLGRNQDLTKKRNG
ncbi:MAG: SCO family protein [Acidobacteriaceae bacterium]